MTEQIVIPQLEADHVKMKDKDAVYQKIHKMVKDGKEKLQIITDFDRTLSKYHHNGESTKSSYGVFEAIPILPPAFLEGTSQLYKKFRAIEDDPKMTIADKLPHMEDWWKKSEELYIGMPCSEKLIDQAVTDSNVHLRTGSESAFARLQKERVPVLVFSAGLGDIVVAILKRHNILYDNVHVVSNFFKIDNEKVAGFDGELIHVYNKNQHAIENTSYFKDLAHHPNIILMGDSLGDANMNEGVQDQGEVLKIGFLSIHIEEYLPQYLEHFDIVLLDDQTMDVFNALLDKIL
uniref:5'-nucleotidase n=1 Tax=Lygus hesperus TaxID=30085 RepID=A0A0K8SWY5_LYGHE